MGALGMTILAVSVIASVLIFLMTRGHVMLIALPLMVGLPLAGVFGRRR